MGSSKIKLVIFTTCLFGLFIALPGRSQEQEFIGLIKNLLQGDELKNFQQTYSSLPLEVRNKLTKDLLSNPGQITQDLFSFLGPKIQNLMGGLQGGNRGSQSADAENEIEVDTMEMKYSKNTINKQQGAGAGGFDFGPLAGMLGNLVSSNPQMLLQMASGFLQNDNGNGNAGGGGFSFESITSLVTQNLDIDTVLSLASAFGIGGSPDVGNSERRRGEGEVPKKTGMADLLQINELVKYWTKFASSPIGIKVNRVLPRLIKQETLPDALRLLEKETSFRFDVILRQLQDPNIRKVLVNQAVKPIGKFIQSIKVPSDLKDVLAKADDILNKKLGLGVKANEFIEPAFNYVRDTFSITRDSFMDLKAEDVEKIAADVMNKEILDPLSAVWIVHEKARKNSQCAVFAYCHLNYNYHNENFIRRNVIKTSSIISAFQVSAAMKKDAFSQLYEGAYKGAEGYDCTHGVNTRCLDLMGATAHNEL